MSDRTGITSGLRAAFSYEMATDSMTRTSASIDAGELMDLCDAIDSVHAALEAENNGLKVKYVNANRKSIDLEAKCERLCEQHDNGWVRLPCDGEAPSKQLAEWIESRGLVTGPLDANGELWHRGDMSDSPWGEIESIAFDGYRWQVSGHDTSAPWIPADSIGHYHAPTVEDVLREFGDWYTFTRGGCDEDAIIAEYAAKFRLTGEDA